MDTNQVSLTRTMLNISTPNNQGVNFSKGEIVKGVVQEVRSDGTVMITIKGETIEAATEVPVKPGQQLFLKVDDFREGKTFLKVVTPQAMEVIENANLSANLLEMGIAAKEENVAMARKLLEYNMPVTANNLSEMAKGVKLLGAATPRNLEIVAFVMSRNLPVDAANLKAMEQYTLPGSNIAKLIQSVVQILRELGQTQTAAPTVNIEAMLPADIENTSTNTRVASNSAVRIDNSGVVATPNPNSIDADASTQIVRQNASVLSNQGVSLPTPEIAGQTKSSVIVPGKSDAAASSSASNAAAASPVNTTGSPGTSPPLVEITRPLNPSGPDTQPTLSTGSAPAETIGPGPALRNDTAAMPPPTTGQPSNPAVIVNEGPEGPAVAPGGTGNAEVPEEISAGQTGPKPAEPAIARPVSPLPGQTAPAGVTADIPAVTDKTSAIPVNPGILPEGEAAPDTPVLLTRTPDTTAAGSGMKSPGIIQGKAGDSIRMPVSSSAESASTIGQTPAPTTGLESAVTQQATAGASRLNDQINVLRTVIEWMQVDGKESSAEISGKLERSMASDKEVIRGLTLLQDAIKTENTQARSPIVNDLLQRIDNLEKELSGQKIFNYLSRTTNDNQFNFYYFSIPVRVGEQMHQCQLRFNKDGRRDLRNVDSLSFVVSLDTANLGMVLFHVNWQRSGTLTLQGIVESDRVAEHLNSNVQGLVSKLRDLGYSVQNLGIKVSREQIDESLKIQVKEAPLNIRPLGIDITV